MIQQGRPVQLDAKLVRRLTWLTVTICAASLFLGLQRVHMFTALLVIAGLCALTSSVAHYVIFSPIRELVSMARAVGSGDFSKRLGFARRDEIGRLALELDTLCDQLQAAQHASELHIAELERLRHSDRIATLGRLASSVAHELGNPLNVIELRAQLITSSVGAPIEEAQRNAEIIVEQTRRMTRIIGEILSFARVRPAKLTQLELSAVVTKAVGLCMHTAKRQGATIELDLPASALSIDGDADKLLQVIVNLVANGIQAMPGGGALRIGTFVDRVAPVDDPQSAPRDFACVEIADSGVGILAEHLAKVFEPFFSTKNLEGGTGLGLSVAQGIAREHAGWIAVTSEPGQGSAFRLYLPMQRHADDATHASQGSTH